MARIRLTEAQFNNIIKKSVKRAINEGLQDDAMTKFEEIKELYRGNEEELIGYMWNFIDDKPGFVNYMETSGNLGFNDEEDF